MIQDIEISSIVPHPDNPRLFLRQEVIDGIAAQIQASGSQFDQAHALLVRPVNSHYEILRGHHRIEAAKKAGLDRVPCWVREMDDDEAYMQLALGNVQNELSPLEIGIHALKVVENGSGGRGNKGGVSGYAEQLGRTKQYVSEMRQAAKVLQSVKLSTQVDGLIDKAKHLSHIHKAPGEAWGYLVDEMLARGWSAKDTEAQVKKIRDVIDATPDWWSVNKLTITQLCFDGKGKSIKAAFVYAGQVAGRLATVTLYHLEQTETTKIQDGREFTLWQPKPVEYEAQASQPPAHLRRRSRRKR